MSLESARFPYNFPKDEDHSQKCSGTSRSARIATATIVKQIQFPSTLSACSIKTALSPANTYDEWYFGRDFSKYFHSIAHSPVSVLQAKHAQMDARTTEAAQKGPCQDRRESGSFAAGLL